MYNIPWKSLTTLNESIFNTEWGFAKLLLFDWFFCEIPLCWDVDANGCCTWFSFFDSESYKYKHKEFKKKKQEMYSNSITKGKPNSLRPQLTWPKRLLNTSATGEIKFGGGKTWSVHVGHVWPLGAVFAGNDDSRSFKQSQWNTSK